MIRENRMVAMLLAMLFFVLILGFCGCDIKDPWDDHGIYMTEQAAQEHAAKLYPHDQGYTTGVSCYALRSCNITVLHPDKEPIFLYARCQYLYQDKFVCRLGQRYD